MKFSFSTNLIVDLCPPISFNDAQIYSRSRCFSWFYGLPQSGKSRLVDHLLISIDEKVIKFPAEQALTRETFLALLQKNLEIKENIDNSSKIIEFLNQKKRIVVIDPFIPGNDPHLWDLLHEIKIQLRNSKLWLVTRENRPELDMGCLIFSLFPHQIKNPIFENELLPYSENRLLNPDLNRSAGFYRQFWQHYQKFLSIEERKIFKQWVLAYFPIARKNISFKDFEEEKIIGNLIIKGFLIAYKDKICLHPFFKDPYFIKQISLEQNDNNFLDFISNPPEVLLFIYEKGRDKKRLQQELKTFSQADIQKELNFFKFFLKQKFTEKKMSASLIEIFTKVAPLVGATNYGISFLKNLNNKKPDYKPLLVNSYLASLYQFIGNFPRANHHYYKAMDTPNISKNSKENIKFRLILENLQQGKAKTLLKRVIAEGKKITLSSMQARANKIRYELIKGRCYLQLQKFRESEKCLKKVFTQSRRNGFNIQTIQACFFLAQLKLKEGNLSSARYYIETGINCNELTLGSPFVSLFDLLKSKYYLLYWQKGQSETEQRILEKCNLHLEKVRNRFANNYDKNLRPLYFLILGKYNLLQGLVRDAKQAFRKAKLFSLKVRDRYFYFKSRLAIQRVYLDFPGPKLQLQKLETNLSRIFNSLVKYDFLNLQMDACLLLTEFYMQRERWKKALGLLEDCWQKAQWYSLSHRKFKLIHKGFDCATSLNRDVHKWEFLLKSSQEKFPGDSSIMAYREVKNLIKVSIAGKINYFPARLLPAIRTDNRNLPEINLKDRDIKYGKVVVSFKKFHRIARYIDFFCNESPGYKSNQQIFDIAENNDDFCSELDGNKLRQYIKRFRKIFNSVQPGLGDNSISKTGEGGYEFRKEKFLIIFD
ncbi:tetratricopeptide repeat protein [Candidatus Riflebacteria bacterium]